MESYSAVERYELLIHATTTWMNLKDVILSEIKVIFSVKYNQSQKVIFYMISFVWHSQKDRTIMMETVIARG